MLAPGTSAPLFRLQDHNGQWVDLAALRGQRHMVLFFYPKDDTPGCTREACGFRDAFADLQAHDAVVVGVSGDDLASHRRFAERWHLPFHLVCDADGALRRAYQVKRTLGLWPGRVTYVIDNNGIIRSALNAPFQPVRHVQEALAALSDQRRV